jgi:hypothetical protein
VSAVQLGQPIAGELPQPRIERERAILEIIGELLDRLGQRFLDHIRRIEAGGQPAIHAHGYHLPQTVLVANEQMLACRQVALLSPLEQWVRV